MSTRLPSEQRREAFARAALSLLAETPAERLSTRAVAQAVGVSQPAIFRHFRSREQLLLAAVERAQADLEGLALEIVQAPAGNTLNRLERLAEGLLAYVERYPALPRLLFGTVGMGPVSGASDQAENAVRTAVIRMSSMQRALVVALVRDAQREGAVSGRLDPTDAALLFMGMLQGLVLAWEHGGRPAGLQTRLPALVALWRGGVGRSADEPLPEPAPAPPDTAEPFAHVDARPLLAKGIDPLAHILSALEALPLRGVLTLVAPFRPAPLLALMTRNGHIAEAETMADAHGAWLVLVVKGGAGVTDLRELEAPEPLEHVLAASAALRQAEIALFRVPRFPALLVTHLRSRAVPYALAALPDGTALVRIGPLP